MTVVVCFVLAWAFTCTALAIFSPFPLPRTMDDVVREMEENNQNYPTRHSAFYAAKGREPLAGPRSLPQSNGVAATRYVRVRKATVLVIIDWVCLFMTSSSICFLICDVTAHGFLFSGSILPVVLIVAFPLLNSYADRLFDLSQQ